VRGELLVEREHLEIRAIQNRIELDLNRDVAIAVEAMRGKARLMASALLGRRGYTVSETPRLWTAAAKQFFQLMETPAPQAGKK
jgi:hypothetical protein